MRKCIFCSSEIPETRQKSAKYCSDLCKTKAHRVKHGIPEPFGKIFDGQPIQGYVCCKDAHFVSKDNGVTLLCSRCRSVWKRTG